MIRHTHEDALSEVIGFILIIAVLTIIASLYLVYVVPAQGREAEIAHMNYVQDQFVDFKIRMDSLWLNNEPNVTVSQNIEMGTLGSKTEGNLAIIPILQPVGSDGAIEVAPDNSEESPSKRNPFYAEISFEMSAYLAPISKTIPPGLYAGSGIYPIQFVNITSDFEPETLFEPNPPYLYLGQVTPVNLSASGVPPWRVEFQVANLSPMDSALEDDYVYDLQMSIVKSDNDIERNVLLNATIAHGIARDGSVEYSVDLYDPLYGLNENYAYTKVVKSGDSITILDPEQPAFNTIFVEKVTPADIGYTKIGDDEPPFTSTPFPMGVFSYTGNNFYWIPQTYFYQMGGVFLTQNDGMTNKVVPLINLFIGQDELAGIRVTDLNITEYDSSVAGTSPVQVLSRVDKIMKNQFVNETGVYQLSDSINNSKYVQIIIESGNPKLWENTFNQILYEANVTDTATKFPADWVTIWSDADHAYMRVDGKDNLADDFDVTFDYTKVETRIIIQPVGFSNA